MVIKSSFAGHLDEIPFICVDNFTHRCMTSGYHAFFLSHFHADHIQGIEKETTIEVLRKKKLFIYTSEVTVAIITVRHPHLAPHLRSLKLGRNSLSIKTTHKEELLEVTMLPAGHSLGSAMFLFEYENKKVLYTGDFRISKNDVEKYKHLQNNGEPIQIDALYVDTTFQDRPYFPKRSEVVSNVIPHIKRWLGYGEQFRVILSVSAMFGYEGVCNQIYDELKIKSNVNEGDWEIFRQFPKQLYGVTNEDSRILLRSKNRPEENMTNIRFLTITFRALKWTTPNLDEEFMFIFSNLIDVCYSTHCGRDELLHFINYLKPKKITGFPEKFQENNSMLQFTSFLTKKDCDPNENLEISPKKRKIVKKYDEKENCKKNTPKRKLMEVLDW